MCNGERNIDNFDGHFVDLCGNTIYYKITDRWDYQELCHGLKEMVTRSIVYYSDRGPEEIEVYDRIEVMQNVTANVAKRFWDEYQTEKISL
jgi:hypothetical protein